MWFERIFRRRDSAGPVEAAAIFDERFMRRMDRLALSAERFLRGGIAGDHRSMRHTPAAEFGGHRSYALGDDLRFVDWPAAARSDNVLVRLGDAPQDVTVHILLDRSASMGFGEPTKFLAAQRLAAALAYITLVHGDRVVLTPFSAGSDAPSGPLQGRSRLTDLLRFISGLVIAESTVLTTSLRAAAQKTPHGGMLVLISDLLADEPLDVALRGLVPPRWQVVVLHLLDPQELDPGLRGNVSLEDTETGERAMYDVDAKALAEYRRRVRAWYDALEHTCFSAGAAYARFTTDQSLEQTIVPFLQQRRFLEAR